MKDTVIMQDEKWGKQYYTGHFVAYNLLPKRARTDEPKRLSAVRPTRRLRRDDKY
jgi:hypothetical protein